MHRILILPDIRSAGYRISGRISGILSQFLSLYLYPFLSPSCYFPLFALFSLSILFLIPFSFIVPVPPLHSLVSLSFLFSPPYLSSFTFLSFPFACSPFIFSCTVINGNYPELGKLGHPLSALVTEGRLRTQNVMRPTKVIWAHLIFAKVTEGLLRFHELD